MWLSRRLRRWLYAGLTDWTKRSSPLQKLHLLPGRPRLGLEILEDRLPPGNLVSALDAPALLEPPPSASVSHLGAAEYPTAPTTGPTRLAGSTTPLSMQASGESTSSDKAPTPPAREQSTASPAIASEDSLLTSLVFADSFPSEEPTPIPSDSTLPMTPPSGSGAGALPSSSFSMPTSGQAAPVTTSPMTAPTTPPIPPAPVAPRSTTTSDALMTTVQSYYASTTTMYGTTVTPVTPSYVWLMNLTEDRGISSTDGLTSDDTLTANGIGTAGTSFQILIDNKVQGTYQVGSDGKWSVALPKLAEGQHVVSAQLTTGGMPSPLMVTIDTTAPTVTLTAPEFSTTTTPTVTVKLDAGDNYGVNGMVQIDVDLNHNGTFTDEGELGYATGYVMTYPGMTEGTPILISKPLDEGTYQLRVRAQDLAGNEGVSAVATMQVDPNAGFIGSQTLLLLANNPQLWSSDFWDLIHTPSTPASTSPDAPSDDGMSTMPGMTGMPGSNNPVYSLFDPSSPTGFQTRTLDQLRFLDMLMMDDQNRILVHVRSTMGKYLDDMAKALKNDLGMNVLYTTPDQNMVTGYLPLDKIGALPQVANFSAAVPTLRPLTMSGSVTTQGDGAMQADIFRSSYGVDGTGVKVGILSDSVNRVDSNSDGTAGIAESQKTGDLPSAGVQVLSDYSGAGATDEGRAMLEIVYDVAPGAPLAFATAFNGVQSFANNIVALQNAGAKVISDDVIYFNEPMYNDGVVGKAIDQVVGNGAFYTTAANNFSDHAWEGTWNGKTTTVDTVNGTFQDFTGSGDYLQNFTLANNQRIQLTFQWDSAFLENGSPLTNYQVGNDLVAYVTDSTGKILQTFDDINPNTDQAFEFIDFTNDGSYGTTSFALAFRLKSGAAPGRIRWVANSSSQTDPGAQLEGAPSIFGHALAKGAMATGGTIAYDPTTVASFTARGGNMPILFDSAGNRLSTPEIRRKPEFAGPTGGNTSFFGSDVSADPDSFPNFFGTSASAPHVAAAAALLLQQAPTAKPTDLTSHLEKTALDVGPAGFDDRTGYGLVQLRRLVIPNTGGFTADAAEPNESADAASNLGVMYVGTDQSFSNLTIAKKPDGLDDFDWYRWLIAEPGTFKVQIDIASGSGDLELHVFVLNGRTLQEIGSSTNPGVLTRSFTFAVGAGQYIFAEVKGRNSSVGVLDQGTYTLSDSLS